MKIAKHVPFKDKTVAISAAVLEKDGKPVTGVTNEATQSFIENRYLVLRNFIQPEVLDMAMNTWKTMEAHPTGYDAFMSRENDIIDQSPESSLYKSEGGYSFPPAVAMHRYMRDRLRGTLDFDLKETYAYCRKYDRGAYLKAHVDRPSCEISVTICLDYKSDDGTPWSIWAQNDENYVDFDGTGQDMYNISQGKPHRKRTGKKIVLYPGDVLVYQGPNVIHWRDYFAGSYSYHMFLHYTRPDGRIQQFPENAVKQQNVGIARKVTALQYDGRDNIYDSGHKKRALSFDKVSSMFTNWSNTDFGKTGDLKSKYINNFEQLRITPEYKEKLQVAKKIWYDHTRDGTTVNWLSIENPLIENAQVKEFQSIATHVQDEK